MHLISDRFRLETKSRSHVIFHDMLTFFSYEIWVLSAIDKFDQRPSWSIFIYSRGSERSGRVWGSGNGSLVPTRLVCLQWKVPTRRPKRAHKPTHPAGRILSGPQLNFCTSSWPLTSKHAHTNTQITPHTSNTHQRLYISEGNDWHDAFLSPGPSKQQNK